MNTLRLTSGHYFGRAIARRSACGLLMVETTYRPDDTLPWHQHDRPYLLVTLDGVDPVVLGVVLGLAYTLAELPNSYVKRRRGIAPGKLPEHNRLLHAFIDQADSAIACTLAYAALVSIPFSVLVVVTLVGPTLHLVTNLGLYSMGLRREPL